ncbi:hypothetical protein CDES_10120 [Corynebacterium deserti GIMN1.010]|uniref:SPOR domain-containing protein n=1 Tax=Corynebacterium deserti GIMN1.010 TaxID=931089 RepID=A0A0M5ILV2_9CORY|nr:hypothetical protein [Corynebacterium deserti]ALC06406.1 hypothetical protein CDES_10120 [Corynebacterium deserti GIMN1.010]
MAAEDSKWYYDLSTGEVSQGKTSGFENRMGPYDTEEQARKAIEIAAARTEVADDWDEDED